MLYVVCLLLLQSETKIIGLRVGWGGGRSVARSVAWGGGFGERGIA